MARGKKTDNETIYKVMLSHAVTNNYNQTSRDLDIPEPTVRKIVKDNIEKEEFTKLYEQKREDFVKKADKIIDKATTLLDRRLTTALDKQDELDLLLDTVYDVDEEDMKPKEKLEIAKKLSRIQLNALNEITIALGTVYDKRALALGQSTSNQNIKVDNPYKELSTEELKKLAGE